MIAHAADELLAQARRSVAAQRRAMDRAINDFASSTPTDCPLALDTAFLGRPGAGRDAQHRLYHRGWRLAYLIASNIGDHLAAVGDVAGSDAPRAFAHMTLARAALEGAARLSYLLHPSGTVEDRVIRAAALLLASSEEELKAVDELRTGSIELHEAATAAAARRHAEIGDLIGRAGITVTRGRGERLLGVRWRGQGTLVESSPNMTALLRSLFPTRPGAYRVGSGALHSQPWVLDDEDAYDPATRRLEWRLDPSALAGSVDLAIAASALALDVFASMLGQDARPEHREAQRREEAVARLAAELLNR